jgi:hypothetical protein
MGDQASVPADQSAGIGPASTIGRPYYDPNWGRWLVNPGGGHTRTATREEISREQRAGSSPAGRVQRSTQQQRGK